jgi:Cd2+/Zn2+-exporting ATPase
MDCAACARKVETAVRQVPGVSQVQVLFATEKLLVNAEGDVRAQVERRYVRRAIRCAMPMPPRRENLGLRENLPLLTLVIMMALSWGWSRPTTPPVSWPLLPPPWSACGRLPARRCA